jgi:hypothetical protein
MQSPWSKAAKEHSRLGSLVDAAADLQRALAFGDRCPDRTWVLLRASYTHIQLGETAKVKELAESAGGRHRVGR